MEAFVGKHYLEGWAGFVPEKRKHFPFVYNGIPRSAIDTPKGPIWPVGVPMGAIPEYIRKKLGVSEEEIKRQNEDMTMVTTEESRYNKAVGPTDSEKEVMKQAFKQIMVLFGRSGLSKKYKAMVLRSCMVELVGAQKTLTMLHEMVSGKEKA